MAVTGRRCPVKICPTGQKTDRSNSCANQLFDAFLRAKRRDLPRAGWRLARILADKHAEPGPITTPILAHQVLADQGVTVLPPTASESWYRPCPIDGQ